MILLDDQPLIGSEIINKLIDSYRLSRRNIIITVHLRHIGLPVIFNCQYRSELLSTSDQIDKEVIRKHHTDVVEVSVGSPNILIDIDTYQEYQAVKAYLNEGVIKDGRYF